jgi:hypothetical protein
MSTTWSWSAELFRRLVNQRAAWPHGVVLALKPRSLSPGIRHVLELLHLQELVAEEPEHELGLPSVTLGKEFRL